MNQINKALLRSKNHFQTLIDDSSFDFGPDREIYEIDKALCQVNTVNELLEAQKEYIRMLENELTETVPFAARNGWKSYQYEKGVEIRERITSLNAIIRQAINDKIEREKKESK